jgi:predicted PurR-regulated permease PerM
VQPFDDEIDDDLDQTMSLRRLPTSPGTESIVDKRAAVDRRQSTTRILLISLVVIAILYTAKPVVVPVALAILFSFLLTPIVRSLERTFIRRTGAIALSLGLAVASLAFGGWWIVQQLNAVAKEISQAAASGHIEEKLKFLRRTSGGTLAVVERTLQRVEDARARPEQPDLKVRVIPERRTFGQR